MYDTIYHISDIHIRLKDRHLEYRNVFDNLYKKLNRKKKNSLIVLTGDILHSKDELSPECIDLTIDFFSIDKCYRRRGAVRIDAKRVPYKPR